MPTLAELKAKLNANKIKSNISQSNGLPGGDTESNTVKPESKKEYSGVDTSNADAELDKQHILDSEQINIGTSTIGNNPEASASENRESETLHILHSSNNENNDTQSGNAPVSLINIKANKLANLDKLVEAEIENESTNESEDDDLSDSNDQTFNELSITAILAKEFRSTEEGIELFRKIYIQFGNAVKDLTIREIEGRIDFCEKGIKIIQALQQACLTVKGDKLNKESKEDKLKRLEEDKKYKPKPRPKMNKDGTKADVLPGQLVTGREKLIQKFMKSGMSRAKAEMLLDDED